MLTIQTPCLPENDLPIVQPLAEDDLLNLVPHRLLNRFQTITLTSRLICWDKMWMYFVQRIEAACALASLSAVRMAFVEADGIVVPTLEVASRLSFTDPAPTVLAWVAQWTDIDNAFALT